MKRQGYLQSKKKYLQIIIFDMGLVCRIYKELSNFSIKKTIELENGDKL